MKFIKLTSKTQTFIYPLSELKYFSHHESDFCEMQIGEEGHVLYVDNKKFYEFMDFLKNKKRFFEAEYVNCRE